MNTESAAPVTSPAKPSAIDRLKILNRDQLKLFALLMMTLGHWAFHIYHITENKPLLRFSIAAQYFAPPVFFFFIAEGFHYTRSKKKYALRLLLFAVITQIPHALSDPDGFTLYTVLLKWSVLMTLFLGLLALIVLHSDRKLIIRLLLIAALMALSRLIHAEWAVGGIALILCFDLLRERPLLRLLGFCATACIVLTVTLMRLPQANDLLRYFVPFGCAILLITFFYNGKQGHFPAISKYAFYIWYPLHLLLSRIFGLFS